MTTATRQAITEQNPVTVPLYTLWDTSRYLHIPPWAALALGSHRTFRLEPEWLFFPFTPCFLPCPAPVDDIGDISEFQERINFVQLADLFVGTAVLQCLEDWLRGQSWSLDRWLYVYRHLARTVEEHRHPALFETAAQEALIGALLQRFQGLEEFRADKLRQSFRWRLDRIEQQDGGPVRLFPFSREPAADAPRLIVLDPRQRFGRPILLGRGVPTDILVERFRAGDSVAALAEDYEIPLPEVEEALRYETLPAGVPSPFVGR